MRVQERMVGAEDAQYWLSINTGNRRLSMIRVMQMRGAIVRGEWRPNIDAVGIEGTERQPGAVLINGQHRAMALVLADEEIPGIKIPMLVADELNPDSGPVIDIGKARNLEDTLVFLGEGEDIHARPRSLAAGLTLAWHIQEGTYQSRQPTPTRIQLVEFLKGEGQDIRDAVPIGQQISRGAHMPASGLIGATWLIGRSPNVHRLEQFASELSHGESLTSKDATYRLREMFTHWSTDRHIDRGRPWKVCAFTIWTWNLFLAGKAKDTKFFRPTGIPEAK